MKNFTKLISVIMALSFVLCLSSCKKKQETATTTKATTTTSANANKNPLTGVSDLAADAIGKRPIAVVVQNSPASRPQWGMCSPDIIIEGLVEGGITRMLWLYSDVNKIPKVGSIRSARIDFIEMAEGFDAIFVHWGRSATADAALNNRNVDDIDGLYYSTKYFARDQARRNSGYSLEHTAYTTGEMISKGISELSLRTDIKSDYKNLLSFNKESSPAAYSSGSCSSVKFKYSNSFVYTYNYDSATKKYFSNLNGKAFCEDGGTQLSVTNVIILYFPSYSVINSKGSIDMDLTGGTGIICSNGTYETIKWEKGNTPSNPIKLYTNDGKTLKLNAGKSYIGFVPNSNSSSTVIG